MNKKYETISNQINKVEIEKESEKSIWIKGFRRAKRSEYINYFNTFDEAKYFLEVKINFKIQSLKNSLDYYQKKLEEINNLEEKNE